MPTRVQKVLAPTAYGYHGLAERSDDLGKGGVIQEPVVVLPEHDLRDHDRVAVDALQLAHQVAAGDEPGHGDRWAEPGVFQTVDIDLRAGHGTACQHVADEAFGGPAAGDGQANGGTLVPRDRAFGVLPCFVVFRVQEPKQAHAVVDLVVILVGLVRRDGPAGLEVEFV